MKRTDLSTLHNVPLMLREPTTRDAKEGYAEEGRHLVLCRANDRDTVLAIFDRDDLFDAYGNRFACN